MLSVECARVWHRVCVVWIQARGEGPACGSVSLACVFFVFVFVCVLGVPSVGRQVAHKCPGLTV